MILLDRRLSVAPMMEWTDRHCRYLHRLFSPHALLYTEMIVSTALVRGDAARLLEHHAERQGAEGCFRRVPDGRCRIGR